MNRSTVRPVHHLIYRHLYDAQPIACAPDYESAATFAQDVGEGAVVTLHVTHGDVFKPCPSCDPGPARVRPPRAVLALALAAAIETSPFDRLLDDGSLPF